MPTRQTRKSSLFLTELIIAILFFSLSAAICVRLFASAYLLGQQSTYRDAATLQAQSMAALFQNSDGALGDVLAYADATETGEGTGVYTGSITQNGVAYPVTLHVSEGERIATLTIEIATPNAQMASGADAVDAAAQTPILTLQAVAYQPLPFPSTEVPA